MDILITATFLFKGGRFCIRTSRRVSS